MDTYDPENPTSAQIAQHYNAALGCVNLINGTKPERITDDKWAEYVALNKAHLKIMLAKPWWTTEDLSPLQAASE